MKTKVRVKRMELLKVVEGRLRKARADYERQSKAYPVAQDAWRKAVRARLAALLERLDAGKPLNLKYSNRLEFDVEPLKPSRGKELCNLERMKKTLEIGAEDTILLSQEDADWYFGPCDV